MLPLSFHTAIRISAMMLVHCMCSTACGSVFLTDCKTMFKFLFDLFEVRPLDNNLSGVDFFSLLKHLLFFLIITFSNLFAISNIQIVQFDWIAFHVKVDALSRSATNLMTRKATSIVQLFFTSYTSTKKKLRILLLYATYLYMYKVQ